jgi:hypothetical protein
LPESAEHTTLSPEYEDYRRAQKAGEGGPMEIGGATLAWTAMRAGLIDQYVLATPSGPGRRRHAVLHRAGQPGEPERGEDTDVSRRRGPDHVQDEALSSSILLTVGCSVRSSSGPRPATQQTVEVAMFQVDVAQA